MDKFLLQNLFATFTEYGKLPETKQEFLNKFDPIEYRNVLYQLLYSQGFLEEDEHN